MIRECSLDELPDKVKHHISKSLDELRKRNIDLDRVKLFITDYIPMRLQPLIHELGLKGLLTLEAHVVNGMLVLICMDTGHKALFLAPDVARMKNIDE